jgi:hypothetical protein
MKPYTGVWGCHNDWPESLKVLREEEEEEEGNRC